MRSSGTSRERILKVRDRRAREMLEEGTAPQQVAEALNMSEGTVRKLVKTVAREERFGVAPAGGTVGATQRVLEGAKVAEEDLGSEKGFEGLLSAAEGADTSDLTWLVDARDNPEFPAAVRASMALAIVKLNKASAAAVGDEEWVPSGGPKILAQALRDVILCVDDATRAALKEL